jgi:hypothetical protein
LSAFLPSSNSTPKGIRPELAQDKEFIKAEGYSLGAHHPLSELQAKLVHVELSTKGQAIASSKVAEV